MAALVGVNTELVINVHPCIYVHISILFSMMLRHSYIRNKLTDVIISPIVKNKYGDLSSKENYRAISAETDKHMWIFWSTIKGVI